MSISAYEAQGLFDADPSLTHVSFLDGELVLSDSGRTAFDPYTAQALEQFITRYMPAKYSDKPAIEGATLLGSGSDGTAYALDGTEMVVKAVHTGVMPAFNEPVAPITHMELVRGAVESLGLANLKVPKCYGMFFPTSEDTNFVLSEQVHGMNLYSLLHMDSAGMEVSPAYQAHLMNMVLEYAQIEPRLRTGLRANGYNFRDLMEDWGAHNVIVEVAEPGDERPPFTFWIVDQLGYLST